MKKIGQDNSHDLPAPQQDLILELRQLISETRTQVAVAVNSAMTMLY